MRTLDIIILVWLAVLTIPFSVRVTRWIIMWNAAKGICQTCGNVGFMIENNKLKDCPDCEFGKN